jgi:hypothetical protein
MLKQRINYSETIKLPDITKYMPKGYRNAVITQAKFQVQNGLKVLCVEFEVAGGKYDGFQLSTLFFLNYKGRWRLSYLCKALGISGEVSPSQLLGKKLKLRVSPIRKEYMGKTFINYVITRFHPIDRDI